MGQAAVAAATAAVVATAATGRWPYHYYEMFRWIICIGSIYAGYLLRSRPLALTACVAVALAFNPVAPLKMRAYQWRHYDVAAAIAMAVVTFYTLRLRFLASHSVEPDK